MRRDHDSPLLDAHDREHPHVRPDLAEVAVATAELERNPLSAQPDLVRRAAEQVSKLKNDPTPDDVLLYAAGMAAAVA